MGHHLLELMKGHMAHHGYLTVAAALLLENAGLPVPGETILLLASFLAYSEHHLNLWLIIVTGIIAATLGDNLGFILGHYGGRPLLDRYQHFFRISDEAVSRSEQQLKRYGPPIIFVARFIFGLRVVAGPLAGVLGMNWAQFALYNFLGAGLWVTVIASVGYLFGSQWEALLRVMGRANFVIFGVAAAVVVILWWRRRRASHMNPPKIRK
jgi:membrane protein DedA with SNARE-associated domain